MTDQHIHSEEENGFLVPGGYFGQARSRLLHQVSNGGFKTPDGYFEASRERLLKTTAAERKPARVIVLHRAWYAAAASVLLVSAALWFLKPDKAPDMAQVSNDEIVNYVLATGTLNDIPLSELYTGNEPGTVTHEDEEIVNQIDEDILLNEL